ncbi:MAG: UPF0158 family protein, partial [Solirubrobacteraceae bacterium]|nr:UPF0158 family protein [Solirubrobacteraceae bacterium]
RPVVIVVAWYTEFEWTRVKSIAADPERFESTYDAWLEIAERTLRDLLGTGADARRSYIDAGELLAWCTANGKQNDSGARAQFAQQQGPRDAADPPEGFEPFPEPEPPEHIAAPGPRVPVKFDDLLESVEWVTQGDQHGMGNEAYIDRQSGTTVWSGDGIDEEPPEDIDDRRRYVVVPRKTEFDLGRSLAIEFIEEHRPDAVEKVHDFFRRRGAYANFKGLLERADLLDAWYAYERNAAEASLRAWCEEHGFELVREDPVQPR